MLGKSKIGRSYGHKKQTKVPESKIKFTESHVDLFDKFIQSKTIASGSIVKANNVPSVFNLLNVVAIPSSQHPYDQGSLGSCTANAISFGYAFDEIKQHNTIEFMPSRLFIYYNERSMEGTVNSDAGGEIHDGVHSLSTYGVCDEHNWPYNPVNFRTKPTIACYTEAKTARALQFSGLDFSADKTNTDRINTIKTALRSGYPVIFGFTVFDSFESASVAQNGMVPMPSSSDEEVGGHAVVCVGYDDTKQCVLVRNSWGTDWGLQGYFYMPYAYIADTDLADDFWVIQSVSSNASVPGYNSSFLNPVGVNINAVDESGGVVNN